MKKWMVICFLLPALFSRANDGVFYARGNTLVPLKENSIRLKKEILNLTRREDWMQVDIYFEFFNPGSDRELTVGFVTPPAEGDVSDEEAKHPFVKEFMVMSGDQVLPYKIARMKETGFKVSSKLAEGYDFVYYFTVKFKKGLNIIRHSYQYRGGGSVEASRDFDYRLTTGTTWANQAIDDFELNIDMGDHSYFSLPAAFGTFRANWQLVGIGKLSRTTFGIPFMKEGKPHLKMAYLRKGKVQFRCTAFKPTEDLSITQWQMHNEVNLWCETGMKNDFSNLMELFWGDAVDSTLRKMTDAELRLYRNLNFARHGYDFKDEVLKKAFQKYIWYLPEPGVKTETVPDYYVSGEMMQQIITEENRRKEK